MTQRQKYAYYLIVVFSLQIHLGIAYSSLRHFTYEYNINKVEKEREYEGYFDDDL